MYAGEQTGKLDDAKREGLKKISDGKRLKCHRNFESSDVGKKKVPLTDKQKADAAQKTQ